MQSHPEKKAGGGFESPFKAFRTAGPLFGSGIQLAAAVVLMFFFGRWLDANFSTNPWLMIVCVMIGVGGGLFHFIRTVSEVEKEEKKEQQ